MLDQDLFWEIRDERIDTMRLKMIVLNYFISRFDKDFHMQNTRDNGIIFVTLLVYSRK